MSHRAGTYRIDRKAGEDVRIFYPKDLPPDPPLTLGNLDLRLLEKANQSLGRLDGISTLLPDPKLFVYMYVRKEALLSSQIEGTQSSFSELLLSEHEVASHVPSSDVAEVSRYVGAMQYGLERLKEFPLSLRLIREIHGVLLRDGRGAHLGPGEFRTSQNWIGGSRPGNARFVPPPPHEVAARMGALEKFLHDEVPGQAGPLPVLIKAALAHVQFETIHPFLDGNGRLGRLLITLLLCWSGVLRQPVLYLSLYFKSRRDEYYELLQKVRDHGVWEEWLQFFLRGIHETAGQAVETANKIVALFESHRQVILGLGSKASSALRVHEVLQKAAVATVAQAAAQAGLSQPTVRSRLEALEGLGIVEEVTGKQRDRLYLYRPYVDILSEGTEPLPPAR